MKLHLGCGKRFIPGFYHIDAVPFPHIDLVHSVDRIPMVADESCELIYACHILEHFQRRDVNRVLVEWKRMLKPKGVLRLAVPDFGALCKLYQETRNLDQIIGPLFGRGDYLYNIHYSTFDARTLSDEIELAGFTNSRFYDWRTTEHGEVDDYSQSYFPHMAHRPSGQLVASSSDVKGLLLSLNMEAVK